jgi:hypothetical protein
VKNRLKNVDYIVVLAILSVSALTGIIQYFTSLNIVVGYIELVGPLAILVSTVIMYQIARNCRTKIGRHIKIICIGSSFFVMGWSHRLLNRTVNLETLGIPVDFTTAFFVALAIGGMILMAYGFYMVKEEAKLIGNS